MIEINNKTDCTGCGACVNACPFRIIQLCDDNEGFPYPKVEMAKCIDCHLCEKTCPMIIEIDFKPVSLGDYPQFFAGQLICKEDLFEVSSGGAFWAFAKTLIDIGGVVYGAVQENVDIIRHVRAEDMNSIARIRRSKYFQSDTGFTFQQVKDDLKKGRLVLYSGTGCQIAGLKKFLSKDYDNLYTCDVVCHGVPSKIVWKTYREEKERLEGKTMESLVFRDKTLGWSKNQYKITYSDGTIERELSVKQLFHAGYLQGLFYRPSCGSCRFASLPRVSDITLADYWKYKGRFRRRGSDFGVSLIAVNTSKGDDLLHMSDKYLKYDVTERELALSSCKHLDEHPTENPDREAFFQLFFEHGYHAAAKRYIVVPKEDSLLSKVKVRITNFFNCLNKY